MNNSEGTDKDNTDPENPENPDSQQEEFSKLFINANQDLLDNRYEISLNKYKKLDSKIYNPGLTHNLGLNLLVLKNYEEGLKQFEKNIEKIPQYHLSYLGATNSYMYMKKYQEALDIANKYISVPDIFIHPQIFLLLNYIYIIMNDTTMANKSYEFAMELIKRVDNISETDHFVQCYFESGSNKLFYII